MNHKTSQEQRATSRATTAYLYAVNSDAVVRDIFGQDHAHDYTTERSTVYARSPAQALMYLDERHFDRFVDAVMQRQGQARHCDFSWPAPRRLFLCPLRTR